MGSTLGFMTRGPPSIDGDNNNKFPPTRGPKAVLSPAVRGTACRQQEQLTAMMRTMRAATKEDGKQQQ